MVATQLYNCTEPTIYAAVSRVVLSLTLTLFASLCRRRRRLQWFSRLRVQTRSWSCAVNRQHNDDHDDDDDDENATVQLRRETIINR